MFWLNWLPWRFVIRRVARARGFLDPIALQARMQKFTQPSEVSEPIELLRAGAVFHARGLLNSRVIQHNLDWVWPYWTERQFDPEDDAFVPRAFSITHINLTHRNWTAVGLPDFTELPIVDPRGLTTPFLDRWSLDAWIVTEDGRRLLPSRELKAAQRLELSNDDLAVVTDTGREGLRLRTRVKVSNDQKDSVPVCEFALQAKSASAAWAVLTLRPYNPEGVSFIRKIELSDARNSWIIDDQYRVRFDAAADRHHISDYRHGDVNIHLQDLSDEKRGQCDVEMATAAALFKLEPGQPRKIIARIALTNGAEEASAGKHYSWKESLRGSCRLQIPDARWQRLYEAALRTLILHTPREVYAGPFTYKRFWYRDAAFIVNALVCAGLFDRAERALDYFPSGQNAAGYFHSQEGEWDSNGEVLWIFERFCRFSGRPLKDEWRDPVRRGARWIKRKRLPDDLDAVHAGLLPAGFSAEHLGPSDFYYWDDFWGVAGLQAASRLLKDIGDEQESRQLQREAKIFMAAIERSLQQVAKRLHRPLLPASPYRRLDAGAIGSIAAGYPLQLYPAKNPSLLNTVEFLLDECFVRGGFFQDMIHSGINCYLTLQVAQILLRAGDSRYLQLMNTIAGLASGTGQWPEAVHPRTGGGCMGDGQHVWAASEWLLMMRNCFVREEGDSLIIASGIPAKWLESREKISFGPAPTAFGEVSIDIEPGEDEIVVSWRASWRFVPETVEVHLAGFPPTALNAQQKHITFSRAFSEDGVEA